MIHLVLVLVIIGVLLWVLNTYIPIDAQVKRIINIVVIICVVIWLLGVFGLLDAVDVPVPHFHSHGIYLLPR